MPDPSTTDGLGQRIRMTGQLTDHGRLGVVGEEEEEVISLEDHHQGMVIGGSHHVDLTHLQVVVTTGDVWTTPQMAAVQAVLLLHMRLEADLMSGETVHPPPIEAVRLQLVDGAHHLVFTEVFRPDDRASHLCDAACHPVLGGFPREAAYHLMTARMANTPQSTLTVGADELARDHARL